MKKFNEFAKLYRRYTQQERLFYWRGISRLGEPAFGQLRSISRKEAIQTLRKQDLILKKIKRKHSWPRSINAADISMVTTQLAALLTSGISLSQTLHMLNFCQTNPRLINLITTIQLDINAGLGFSEALQRHPQWFDNLVCALVGMGERSGTLVVIMNQVAAYHSKKEQTKQQLQTILFYPLCVLFLASIVSIHLLITVVPQFQALFHNFQAELPRSTQFIIGLSRGLKTYGIISLLGMVMIYTLLCNAYHRYTRVAKLCDLGLLHIPGIGQLYQYMAISRSFNTLAIANHASLPLSDALQWVAEGCNNHCFAEGFLQIRAALTQGDSLRAAVFNTGLFPELVIQMLSLGEQSGTLQTILFDLSQYYSQRVDASVQRLSRLIEPALMIVLGLIVGGLVIAMYLPILKLGALI